MLLCVLDGAEKWGVRWLRDAEGVAEKCAEGGVITRECCTRFGREPQFRQISAANNTM